MEIKHLGLKVENLVADLGSAQGACVPPPVLPRCKKIREDLHCHDGTGNYHIVVYFY